MEFLGGLETRIETVTHESTVVDVACRSEEHSISKRIFRLLILQVCLQSNRCLWVHKAVETAVR